MHRFQVVVWARRGPTEQNQTALTLEIALNSISFFKDYFATVEALPPTISK